MMALVWVAFAAWLYLLTAHGRFWSAGPSLAPALPSAAPAVDVIVPARDEAGSVALCLRSLAAQDYAGTLRIILVDDRSTDGTGAIARAIADPRLHVQDGADRPEGWSGKLWAVAQGVQASSAPLLLLCDADIVHEPAHVATLVAKLQSARLDLVSEMVALNCASAAERALVPAFVFFFQLLYPFALVNDPRHRLAAAAGGTVLLRRAALDRIGGIASVRGALIDDVALATAVKRSGGAVWLGHSQLARSIRPYPAPVDVWRMVARTAYVQLRFSPLILAGTVAGLALVWLLHRRLLVVFGEGVERWMGLPPAPGPGPLASYLPTLRRFRLSPAWVLALPAVAASSTWRRPSGRPGQSSFRGRGAVWKRGAVTVRRAL